MHRDLIREDGVYHAFLHAAGIHSRSILCELVGLQPLLIHSRVYKPLSF